MRKYPFLLCGLVLLCACARHPAVVPDLPEQQAQRDALWKRYTASPLPPHPYRIQMSLRLGKEGDTRRVVAILWGNNTQELRCDIMAGVGAIVAKIHEDAQRFLVYSPMDNKAYFHNGANKPLLQVGVPIPFNLEHLAALLLGRYAEAFGLTYTTASFDADGRPQYDLEGSPGGRLTLNEAGQPVAWQEHPHGDGWRMQLAYTEEAPSLPRRLTLLHSNGQRALVLVKEREKPAEAFGKAQLALSVPRSTPLLPLSQYKRP